MSTGFRIEPLDPLDGRIHSLAIEAREEGYRFVQRLISDAQSGQNLFKGDGEIFLGAFINGQLIGCGGVNIDPYSDQRLGRLRHVFVAKGARRKKVGKRLVLLLVERSRQSFRTIRLRTPDRRAQAFYDAIGFSRTKEEMATHIMQL